MNLALRFEGVRGRIAYLVASSAVFFSQHLAVIAVGVATHQAAPRVWWFWLNPFRTLLFDQLANQSSPVLALGMVATCISDAALLWLAFCRGRNSQSGGWIATLAVVPVIQLGVIAWLTVAPDRSGATDVSDLPRGHLDARTAATGLMVGVGMVVATVALSALVFRLYGYVLFLVSPFLIAMAVAYLANRKGQVGMGRTLGLVLVTFSLGGLTLVGFAFEGVVCLLLATPLIAIMGLIDACLGVELAKLGRPRGGTTLSSIAIIPLLLAGEAVLPPRATFDSVESVDVAASPAVVWDAVVHMGPIPDAPAPPFRWGLAYPLRGEIMGTGVGSIRRGVFSTGIAYERVTEWAPGRRLSFVVLSDPPSMRELSPYSHVNAPHVKGYFRTLDARFTLMPLTNGKTRLTLSTHHALDLEPALYWTPMAEWAVHANKVRVLKHFQQQAEASVRRLIPDVPQTSGTSAMVGTETR